MLAGTKLGGKGEVEAAQQLLIKLQNIKLS